MQKSLEKIYDLEYILKRFVKSLARFDEYKHLKLSLEYANKIIELFNGYEKNKKYVTFFFLFNFFKCSSI